MCNQAVCFNRCLFKVQQGMHAQLKAIQTEIKGKSASKVAMPTDKLETLRATLQVMRIGDSQAHHTARVCTTLISIRKRNLIRDPTSLHGRASVAEVREIKARVDLLITPPNWSRASSPINDNYCVNVLKAGCWPGAKGL